MTRISFFGFALLLLAATGLYLLKDRVQELERELRATRVAIQTEHGRLDRLRAEWAMLNQPGRLARLAEAHLDLQPAEPTQVVEIGDLPYRDELLLSGRAWLARLPSGADVPLRLKPPRTAGVLLPASDGPGGVRP